MLLIYLDPTPMGAESAFPWVLRSPTGGVARRGVDPVSAMPAASDCVLVLPYHRIALHRKKLPTARREKLQGALYYAVEDASLGDPASTYVAFAGEERDGLSSLVSVEQQTFSAALYALRERGLQPSRMIAETLAPPLVQQGWSAVVRDGGGFVRTSMYSGFSMDLGAPDAPPVLLRLALAEARGAGEAPARLRVHRGGTVPQLSLWRAALGIDIEEAGAWSWETADVQATPDLLQGDLRARSNRLESLRPWLPAGILASAIVAVHIVFTLLYWGFLAWERSSLAREMEVVFRQAVPQAQAMVNPPLQMRRLLADLRRASGTLAGDDFLALLGRAAPEFARAQGANVRMIEYASGVLRVELSVPSAQSAPEVVAKLKEAGLSAKLETSSASGAETLARIAISDRAP